MPKTWREKERYTISNDGVINILKDAPIFSLVILLQPLSKVLVSTNFITRILGSIEKVLLMIMFFNGICLMDIFVAAILFHMSKFLAVLTLMLSITRKGSFLRSGFWIYASFD